MRKRILGYCTFILSLLLTYQLVIAEEIPDGEEDLYEIVRGQKKNGLEDALPEIQSLMKEISEDLDYQSQIELNGKTYHLNENIYKLYGVISYTEDPNFMPSGAEDRYIGVNIHGEDISNPLFPYDDPPPAGADFADLSKYKWIEDPAGDLDVQNKYTSIEKNVFDNETNGVKNNLRYVKKFREGMITQHGAFYDDNNSVDWEKYFHIITPPTAHTNGIARMFFPSRVDGSIRYIDIILAADSTSSVGSYSELKITHDGQDVTNNSSSPIEVSEKDGVVISVNLEIDLTSVVGDELKWMADGSVFDTTPIDAKINSYTIPSGALSVMFTVEPVSNDPAITASAPVGASVHMKLIEHEDDVVVIELDYDQLSKDFILDLNGGNPIVLDFDDPPEQGTWHEVLSGKLILSASSIPLLNDSMAFYDVDAYGGINTNSDSVTPSMSFTTHRDYFGDDPESKVYAGNADIPAEFVVNGSGSSTREYTPKDFIGVDNDNDGEYDNYPVDSASFNPTLKETIRIVAKTYNGSSYIATPSVSTGEKVSTVVTSRGIEWQGDSIPFKVSRNMYEADGSIVEVPGQYTRYYIPQNTGSVEFTPIVSQFEDEYRKLSERPITGLIINAPYTSTTDANTHYTLTGNHSVKSGYFYEFQGSFEAIITTRVYTIDSSDTGHDALVASVIDGFKLISNIPTVEDPKDKTSYNPRYENEYGYGHVIVTTNESTTRDVYTMSAGEYNQFMESDSSFKYTEQLSTIEPFVWASEVVETTVVTFTIPKQYQYIAIDAPDSDYYMAVYIDGFTLPEDYISGSHVGDLSVEELPQGVIRKSNNKQFTDAFYIYNFTVDGNMYEDTNQSD